MELSLILYFTTVLISSIDGTFAFATGNNINGQDILEICDMEIFRPRCFHNEAIVLKSAIYGRMRFGRCIEEGAIFQSFQSLKEDPRYFGCSADVTQIAHKKCSGKKECEIRIPDVDFESQSSCYKDNKKYLEVSYNCLKMVEDDRSCTVDASSDALHLFDSPSAVNGCGTRSNPWPIKGLPGQKIKVHLIDFQAKSNTTEIQQHIDGRDGRDGKSKCYQYGFILDKTEKRNISICGKQMNGERNLYLSESNILDIVFSQSADIQKDQSVQAIVGFTAVGCLDLRAPPDAWFKRSHNEATVGCYTTRQTWHLRCQGNQWIGVFGNCTQHFVAFGKEAFSDIEVKEEGLSNGLVIVCIVGIGLVICLMIICIGVVCLQRRKMKSTKYSTFVSNGANVSNEKDFNPTGLNGVMNIRSADESQINRMSSEPTTIRINQPNNHGDYSVYARGGNGYFGAGEDRLKQAQYFVLDRDAVDHEEVIQS